MLEEEKKEELLALLTGKKYRELKSQLVEMNEVDIASFIEAGDDRAARTSELQPGYEKTDQPVPQLPGKQRRKRHDGGVRGTQEKYDGGAGI